MTMICNFFFHVFHKYKYSRLSIQASSEHFKALFIPKGKTSDKVSSQVTDESHHSLPLENDYSGNSPHIKCIRTLKY